MPPGGDTEGTHSNGHNSTTVGPIEQKLIFLKSSDTALHSDGQQISTNTCNVLKLMEMLELSWRLLALPDLSNDASVWAEAGRLPEWS